MIDDSIGHYHFRVRAPDDGTNDTFLRIPDEVRRSLLTLTQPVDDKGAAYESLAALYIALSGTTQHTNTCATSRAPAYVPGPCDCAASHRVTDIPRK